jgi:hypothetical protein
MISLFIANINQSIRLRYCITYDEVSDKGCAVAAHVPPLSLLLMVGTPGISNHERSELLLVMVVVIEIGLFLR